MKNVTLKEKFDSAYSLLSVDSISIDTFEDVRKLIQGYNPRIDSQLETISHSVVDLKKIFSGDIISLSAAHLPEETEGERKRKKILLFIIKNWNDLLTEVTRVKQEFEGNNPNINSSNHLQQVLSSAKGPFGAITLIAIVIVSFSVVLWGKNNTHSSPSVLPAKSSVVTQSPKVKVILFHGEKLPLSSLHIGHGPDCFSLSGIAVPHYHALQKGIVVALDGKTIEDPGGCGFGKVSETQVVEIVN